MRINRLSCSAASAPQPHCLPPAPPPHPHRVPCAHNQIILSDLVIAWSLPQNEEENMKGLHGTGALLEEGRKIVKLERKLF